MPVHVRFNHLGALKAQLPKIVSQAAAKGAADLLADIQGAMQQQKGGAIYTRDSGVGRGHKANGAGVQHQASAPGQAPAVDSGQLIASVQIDPQPTQPTIARIVTDDPVGVFMEYGTARGVAPRPWAAPAGDRNFPLIIDAIKAALARLGR